jgi:hypothetical protein
MKRMLACAAFLVAFSGCHSTIARHRVLSTAVFDHGCPKEQVVVVREDTDIWAYELDVCGKRRKYRDFGNEQEWQFIDVTDGMPGNLRAK